MRAALLLLLLACALGAAGCGGGGEEAAPVAETVVGTVDAAETGGGDETEMQETEPAETESEDVGGTDTTGSGDAEEQEGGDVPSGDPGKGESVFADNGCGSCHTLEAAGTNGNIGPSLDEAQPPYERVVQFVTNGKGAMPSFKDQLSEEDIANVAAYVVESTKG